MLVLLPLAYLQGGEIKKKTEFPHYHAYTAKMHKQTLLFVLLVGAAMCCAAAPMPIVIWHGVR